MEEVRVREYLSRLGMRKSIGPDEMHPQVLRELDNVMWVHCWLPLKGHGDWGTFLRTGRKPMSLLFSRARRTISELQTDQLHVYCWEDDGASNPGNHYQTYEEQEGDWEWSAWIYKDEIIPHPLHSLLWLKRRPLMRAKQGMLFLLSLTRLSALYPIIYSLIKYGLGKWSVRWTENWLSCQAQRIVISDSKSCWRLGTSSWPQGSTRRQIQFNMFINDLENGTENGTEYTAC